MPTKKTHAKPRRGQFAADVMRGVAELELMVRDGARPEDRFVVRTVRSVEVRPPRPYSAEAVQQLRQALNVSADLFAELLGVPPTSIRAWERGTREPSPIALRLLDAIAADPEGYLNRLSAPV